MPAHFIFEEPDNSILYQGDILRRTEELISILDSYHPFYSQNPSYKYFMVITQTCSLVKRGDKPPNSDYINLVSVRPIEEILIREAKQFQNWWQEPKKIISAEAFNHLLLFTESLLDNNVANYFYIHEDISLGISGFHCAVLPLSIAIRIDHLEICLKSKIAQLQDNFRSKLGWLVGNVYNRIGTKEWDEVHGKDSARKEASRLLKGILITLDDKKIAKGEKELSASKSLTEYSPDEIYSHIVNTKLVSRRKQFEDISKKLFNEKIPVVDPIVSRIITELQKDDLLINELVDKLKKAENNELAEQVVRKFFQDYLRKFNESSFPNRDRIVDRIVATLKEDTLIRELIGGP